MELLEDAPNAFKRCHTANCCAVGKIANGEVIIFETADPETATANISQTGLSALASKMVAAHASLL